MQSPGEMSRRQFVASGGALAAAAALAGCGTARSGATSAPASSIIRPSAAAPTRVAYCTLFIQGAWKGPRNSDGSPSLAIIDEILTPRAGYATPLYLLTSNGGSTGDRRLSFSAEEIAVNSRLVRAGLRPGIRIGLFPADMEVSDALSVENLVEQSRLTRAASDAHGGLYDWLFLDHAWERTPAGRNGLNDLQRIIDGMTAAGWERIMINATSFNAAHLADLPHDTWAMARHFDLMSKDYRSTVPPVISSGSGAVDAGDLQFVDYVRAHRPDSTPMLKLEIPSETQRFRRLSEPDQAKLLELWARASAEHHFRITYPLYVSGADPSGSQATQYDSYSVGTFWEQRSLMARYG